MQQTKSVVAIVTDIEGTTTALDFVHQILFPYARKHLAAFVRAHQHEPAVAEVLAQIEMPTSIAVAEGMEAKIQQLLAWMDADCKITQLKTLQGWIWRQGYAQGDFLGHVYKDAYQQLQVWQAMGIDLYVFSSGSVEAQQLLFAHSDFGDMTPLFSGYFDTRIGAKRDAHAYRQIAEQIHQPPDKIMFLSDIPAELDAAEQAGWQTVCVARGEVLPATHHVIAKDFFAISSEQSWV